MDEVLSNESPTNPQDAAVPPTGPTPGSYSEPPARGSSRSAPRALITATAVVAVAFFTEEARGQSRFCYSTSTEIQCCDADGSGCEVVVGGREDAEGVSACRRSNEICWADGNLGEVGCTALDGSGERILASGLGDLGEVACDEARQILYYVEEEVGRVSRVDLTTGLIAPVVTDLQHPIGLALVPRTNTIVWAEFGAGRIGAANASGLNSGVRTMVFATQPIGVAYEPQSAALVYSERGTNSIMAILPTSASPVTVVANAGPNVAGVAMTADRVVYWIAEGPRELRRMVTTRANPVQEVLVARQDLQLDVTLLKPIAQVSGCVEGLSTTAWACTNVTTGQSVVTGVVAGSFSCTEAGLVADTGDRLTVGVAGTSISTAAPPDPPPGQNE